MFDDNYRINPQYTAPKKNMATTALTGYLLYKAFGGGKTHNNTTYYNNTVYQPTAPVEPEKHYNKKGEEVYRKSWQSILQFFCFLMIVPGVFLAIKHFPNGYFFIGYAILFFVALWVGNAYSFLKPEHTKLDKVADTIILASFCIVGIAIILGYCYLAYRYTFLKNTDFWLGLLYGILTIFGVIFHSSIGAVICDGSMKDYKIKDSILQFVMYYLFGAIFIVPAIVEIQEGSNIFKLIIIMEAVGFLIAVIRLTSGLIKNNRQAAK